MIAELEAILFSAVLGSIVFMLSTRSLTRRSTIGLTVTTFVIAFISTSIWKAFRDTEVTVNDYRPVENPIKGYVSSSGCKSCHPDHYGSWHASFHRTMTQAVSPQSVLGVFDDKPFEINGRQYRLQQRGDEYWAELDGSGADGKPMRFWTRLLMTTGSHHQQVFWYATGKSRILGQLPIVYLVDQQRWVPRESAFLRPPDDVHASEAGRWNMSCNQCHATNGRPGYYDAETMDTQVAELGIACEACHGPGDEHICAHQNPLQRYRVHLGQPVESQRANDIKNPAKMSHERSTEVCGQCHGVTWFHNEQDWEHWLTHGHSFRPGDDLSESRYVCQITGDGTYSAQVQSRLDDDELFIANRFWPDGMIRISGREYNGLLETPCFQHGEMSCLSCHQMHQSTDDQRSIAEWRNDQLQAEMVSDQACLQCHPQIGESISSHTHHGIGSSGSRCYNCHMPHTTYGLLKAIRSHQIDSPSASVTASVGRPNACNLCHLDQTLQWTADYLGQWYGHDSPTLTDVQQSVSASVLGLLTGDACERALIAWHMGWKPAQDASGTSWMVPVLAAGLADPYDAVRLISHRSLQGIVESDSGYDFLASPQSRQVAAGQILRQWKRASAQKNKQRGHHILIQEDGEPDLLGLQELIKQRDETLLRLAE